jgi:dihydrolipoamide dehydrogenase
MQRMRGLFGRTGRGRNMQNGIKEYDVIVIGSGSGANVVNPALSQGLSVALVDKGPLGGTCLNIGCIPSKMLTFPADRVVEIQEARKLGIDAEIKAIDFQAIMERMRRTVSESQNHMREGIGLVPDLDFYEEEGRFTDEDTLQVGNDRIRGRKIFIAAGVRPLIPPITGIGEVDYLTNDNVFELRERPGSILLIGGGYISAELGHFFAAMGTRVTILGRNARLAPQEEPEISALLKAKMMDRMDVHTDTEVIEVQQREEGVVVIARDRVTEEKGEFGAERILIASGRRSNADLLQVENAGIETDARGYVKVNDYLETNRENIWAFGDIIGRHMFRHVANRESAIAWHNSNHDHGVQMDYGAIPHAVFSYPQIASVGLTEAQARQEFDILVGRAGYMDVARGEAMMEEDGFAKAIVDGETGRILGFHIIGPYAPIVIQEVVTAMANDVQAGWLGRGMHIHPALPELIVNTLGNLREPY